MIIHREGVSSHALPEGVARLTIGRADGCDIVIDDPLLSRVHAALHIGGGAGGFAIEDLGSANGTLVRERRVEPGEHTPLGINEAVGLGSAMLIVQPRFRAARAMWMRGHEYFEGRLGEECGRGRRVGGSFALLHVHVTGGVPEEQVAAACGELLESTDVVARYGQDRYEILVEDPAEAEAVARHLAQLFGSAKVRVGSALFPRDGRDPESLMARAIADARGEGADQPGTDGIILVDPAMKNLYDLGDRVARGDISVLITGETGVGKEILAAYLHSRSPRAGKPFLCLNCAALPETVLESELFGHEKGAFTGAVSGKAGLLETAHEGTIFLDEMGELSLAAQAKILRVIEERRVLRVGGLKPRDIEVRFLAATNRDLEEEVANGRFREDLYYRIAGVTLSIPPLRSRRSEVVPLAEVYGSRYAAKLGLTRPFEIDAAARGFLETYNWPGNIRELKNMIERAVLLSGGAVTLEHLPIEKLTSAHLSRPRQTPVPIPIGAPATAPVASDAGPGERDKILQVLAECGGNQTQAARRLGISRTTLSKRLEEQGIPRPRKGG
ncbi:MAG TPA: sigma 54-interacting transcriptional regulator [Kofleriaceae bacterium]|nr:sigma 54-interacting transcriptional regulator [Kofleriaceae bacterium]